MKKNLTIESLSKDFWKQTRENNTQKYIAYRLRKAKKTFSLLELEIITDLVEDEETTRITKFTTKADLLGVTKEEVNNWLKA